MASTATLSASGSTESDQKGVIGVIIPPPEIRAVVDKTATFVGRNGKSFEQRILNSAEGQTSKFNFMRPFDPYHAYYEAKIKEVEEEKFANKPATTAKEYREPLEKAADTKSTVHTTVEKTPKIVSAAAKASMVNPVVLLAKEKPPASAPISLEFLQSSISPKGLNACDIDVIKLTAQFTAVNGREFLAQIAQREQRNPQFDFLKPTHMLFSYFTSLVDAYSRIVRPSEELLSRIQQRTLWQQAMRLSVERWLWTKDAEDRQRDENSKADAERIAFSAIDWMDFVVVETIDFPEDEQIRGVLDQSLPLSTEINGLKANTVMDTDDISDLKVVSDYAYDAAAAFSSGKIGAVGKGSESVGGLVRDPLTGKAIPASELSEHMRIQLLDPKWRQQQQRYVEKQRETGFAEGGSIADSLRMFARKRGDIFGQAAGGNASDSAAAIAQQEETYRQKQLEQGLVQWDGHKGSIVSVQQAKADLTAHQQISAPPAATYTSAPGAASGIAGIGPLNFPPHDMIGNSATLPSAPTLFPPAPPPTNLYTTVGALPPAPPPPMLPTATTFSHTGASFHTLPDIAPPPPAPPVFNNATTGYAAEFSDKVSNGPAVKRAKASEATLLSAEEFAATVGDSFQLSVQIPVDSTVAMWGLEGQQIVITEEDFKTFTEPAVSLSVKHLKEALSKQLGGMPPSKMQLKSSLPQQGFLKDAQTFDNLNVGDGVISMELTIKSRGGRR